MSIFPRIIFCIIGSSFQQALCSMHPSMPNVWLYFYKIGETPAWRMTRTRYGVYFQFPYLALCLVTWRAECPFLTFHGKIGLCHLLILYFSTCMHVCCVHMCFFPQSSHITIWGASYLIRTWYKLQTFQSMCFIFKVRNCNQCKKLYYDGSTNPMVQDSSTRFKSQFYKWSKSGKISKILGLSPASEFSSSSSMAKCRIQKTKDWII
jgi:hypothetical protein